MLSSLMDTSPVPVRLSAFGRKRSGAKISSATQIVPLALPGLQASEVHRGAELSFSQLFVK